MCFATIESLGQDDRAGGMGENLAGLGNPAIDSGCRETAATRHVKDRPQEPVHRASALALRWPSASCKIFYICQELRLSGTSNPQAISFRSGSEMTSELTDGLGSII